MPSQLAADGRGAPQEAPGRKTQRSFRGLPQGGAPPPPTHPRAPSRRRVERAPQECEALRQRGHRAFVAFEFERDVAAIIHFAKDGGDLLVVEVERVINAAAVIRL